jgi:hypothetical protein
MVLSWHFASRRPIDLPQGLHDDIETPTAPAKLGVAGAVGLGKACQKQ